MRRYLRKVQFTVPAISVHFYGMSETSTTSYKPRPSQKQPSRECRKLPLNIKLAINLNKVDSDSRDESWQLFTNLKAFIHVFNHAFKLDGSITARRIRYSLRSVIPSHYRGLFTVDAAPRIPLCAVVANNI